MDSPSISRTAFRTLLREACTKHGANFEDTIKGRRYWRSRLARAEVMHELRGRGMPFTEIGRHFNMHHTSVLHVLSVTERPLNVYGPIPVPDLSGEWAI